MYNSEAKKIVNNPQFIVNKAVNNNNLINNISSQKQKNRTRFFSFLSLYSLIFSSANTCIKVSILSLIYFIKVSSSFFNNFNLLSLSSDSFKLSFDFDWDYKYKYYL